MKNELANVTINPVGTFSFKNAALNNYSARIASLGTDMANKNKEIASILGRVMTEECYKDDGFKSVAEYAAETFGVKKDYAYMLARVGARFYNNDSSTAKWLAESMPVSNLNEITKLTDAEIEKAIENGDISEKSTQKDLRALKDSAKANETKAEKLYNIEFLLVKMDTLDTVFVKFDRKPLSIVSDFITKKGGAKEVIEKTFVSEGKKDGKYNKGVRLYYGNNGCFGKAVFTPFVEVKAPTRKTTTEHAFTVAELEKMLADMKAKEAKKK